MQIMLQDEAFNYEKIIDEFGDNLIFFINKYVNNFDWAEDLMMDTFAALFISKSKFQNKSSFKTYLFAIAKNKAITFLRKKKNSDSYISQQMRNDYDSLKSKILENEKNAILYDAINRLPEDYRNVIYLQYFEKMSSDQIAKVLNKNKKQVYNISVRAKEKLRGLINKEDFK